MPKRDGGLDLRGATGGNVAGQERHRQNQKAGRREGHRIPWRDIVQKVNNSTWHSHQ